MLSSTLTILLILTKDLWTMSNVPKRKSKSPAKKSEKKKRTDNEVKCGNILSYFKAPNNQVACPACGVNVSKAKINEHLDKDCASLSEPVQSVPSETTDCFDDPSCSSSFIYEKEDCDLKIDDDEALRVECGETFDKAEPSQRDIIVINEFDSKCQNEKVTENVENDVPNSQQDSFDVTDTMMPYYVDNFHLVMKAVISDPIDGILFDDDDRRIIDNFFQLSLNAQKLYVRLFQRKVKWQSVAKLKYPDICSDLMPTIAELVKNEYLLDESHLNDLGAVLNLMQVTELKLLVKDLNLNPSKSQKQQMIEQVLKHAKGQRTMLDFVKVKSNAKIVLDLAKKHLGSCVHLSESEGKTFRRALVLFTMTNYSAADERMSSREGYMLTTVYLNRKAAFPLYETCRERRIFSRKDDLVKYDALCDVQASIMNAMEASRFEEAFELFADCKSTYSYLNVYEMNPALPDVSFLRKFNAETVYLRCLSLGVEILQRLKKYAEAVEQLQELLSQDVYLLNYRGRWTERLALNLDQHLKRHRDALDVIASGLNDPNIRFGVKLALYLRAKKICSAKKAGKLKSYLEKLPVISVVEAPKVYVEGTKMPNNQMGQKNYFISKNFEDSPNGEATLCSVEEFAKNHYWHLGYTEGIHGESATFSSLYALLFWDIIYASGIADVFRNPHQAWPLDLNCEEFYRSRQESIEERLGWIRNASHPELINRMLHTWMENEGRASLVSWENFRDFPQLQTLVECISPSILASVCEKYAKNYRHNRSGFPDLTVWNHDEKLFKIVEVKGPNDHLSTQQMMWLDFLVSIGIEAEVCHVTATNAKRLKRNQNDYFD